MKIAANQPRNATAKWLMSSESVHTVRLVTKKRLIGAKHAQTKVEAPKSFDTRSQAPVSVDPCQKMQQRTATFVCASPLAALPSNVHSEGRAACGASLSTVLLGLIATRHQTKAERLNVARI